MVDVIVNDVIEFAPELRAVSPVAWARILAYVNRLTSVGIGDDETTMLARIYLAAHYGTVNKRGRTGAAGPLTSEAVGATRRSFGLVALAAGDASLGATGYGQQYIGLIQSSLAAGPRLVE